ncbi:MAG: 3-deoxy-D-manno-octulosonic-acid transferase [Thiomicrorhabdus sp.]|nr:MAG: 3-deoxy-D-manno-octulosonic-acid transferase [Thiomicrorhabdus sp.]
MVYQLLIRLLSPLIWLLILIDSFKKQGGRVFFLQRLGLEYPKLPTVSKRIWFHCASVGEVKAAEPLIRALEAEYHILITTNTPTGKQLVDNLFGDSVQHSYLPLDWPFAIRHFLDSCCPTDCWILETEIWPNLYRLCHQRNIDLRILNARLSRKTLKAPNWLKQSYQQSLQKVNQILARSQDEAGRFIILGAKPENVHVLGNLKYAQLDQVPHNPNPIGRDYILLASSHEDEELQMSKLWLALNRPELLVIVPRHPKRSEMIQKQLITLDASLSVASKGQQPTEHNSIHLDDRLGKLMPLFEHAKLVIMGGSFVAKGGHNALEPAAYQRAIITGPDVSDFETETALLLQSSGIIQCQSYEALSQNILQLINDSELRATLGKNALVAIQSQADTLQNYLDALLDSNTNNNQ